MMHHPPAVGAQAQIKLNSIGAVRNSLPKCSHRVLVTENG
jgi:hypothetical protein